MATLITGASSGIGEEIAKLAAADKQDVVLVARSADKLEALAETLARAHGIRATALAEDLSDPAAIDVIADVLAARKIEIDALVNNAGFGVWGRFVETDIEQQRQMLQVNVVALTMLTRRLLPLMLGRGRGRVLNVASTAAFQAGPLMATYYASKAYVLLFSEALTEELAGTGVTVTCLCPGPTETGFSARAGNQRSRLFAFGVVMDAYSVARAGYEAMKAGQPLVITGLVNKLLIQSLRISPRRLVTKFVRKLNEKS
jgi:short-subunit dehydrogenase